jgi:hypothetical protein
MDKQDKQDQARPSKTKQDQARPSKTKQDQARPSKTKQDGQSEPDLKAGTIPALD